MTPSLTRAFPLVLALLTASCGGSPPPAAIARPPESSIPALQALEDGRYDEAGRRFARILAADPNHRDARLGMAEVHLAQGRTEEALALFDSLAEDPLSRPRALEGRGLALLSQGRRGAADIALRKATDGSAMLWRAWDGQGRIADAEKRWKDADEHYAKALENAPRKAGVLCNQGYSLLLRGQPAEAEAPLRRALAEESGLKVAAANLRLALAWQGRYGEALAGMRGDDLPSALNDVGYVAMSRGDLDAAEIYLRRALDLSPRHLLQADANLAALREARQGRKSRIR